MSEKEQHYAVGDLVQFVHNHLNVTNLRTGLVVEYHSDKDRFRIKTSTRDFWVTTDKLKLLSKASEQ